MLRTWGSVLTVSAMLLSGCAPHPGTGNWVPDEADNSGFVRIHVQYDGKMDFYRDGEDAAVMHCFWAGESETAIGLQCTLAENPDIEKHYRLRVSEHQHAELLQGGMLSAATYAPKRGNRGWSLLDKLQRVAVRVSAEECLAT